MQGYLLGIFFILLLVVIDFYLQKKINKKGYVDYYGVADQ